MLESHAFSSTCQFDRVAAGHGFTDTCSFERYLTPLLVEAGIDNEKLRHAEAARCGVHQRLVAMAAREPRLTLWSAATMTTFTVCRGEGQVIWHELFPRDTVLRHGAAAVEASARQAIWLARQARSVWGAEAATLHLILARSRGVDFENLHRVAATADLVLDVVTDPVHNPAEQCRHREAVDWDSSDLGGLLHPRRESA
ncbi:hypothetical protein AB0L63_31515 [Nocardia sp. NPDC051990]|uniref:hypothetical protein n=1 Tax=Nocardia sp. NPDC051990 TaxID=3155285 RepID=UPI0034153C48